MNKSKIQFILLIGLFLLGPQTLFSQKNCEFPTLGYFEILGTKPLLLKDFHEITIGYLGIDKSEDKAGLGTISIRGHLSLVGENPRPSTSRPEFEVISTPQVRSDSFEVGFETAELTIEKKCKQSIRIVTNNTGSRRYEVSARFLSDYEKMNGRLYKLVGSVRVIEEGKPTQTFHVKFARSRE